MSRMRNMILGFMGVMLILTFTLYYIIGSAVVNVVNNPKSTGESIGKYVKDFEEGVDDARNDTISNNK